MGGSIRRMLSSESTRKLSRALGQEDILGNQATDVKDPAYEFAVRIDSRNSYGFDSRILD